MTFAVHPNVYATRPPFVGLRPILENMWIRSHTPGDGTIFIVSGFANFNGGARFYTHFRDHVAAGGEIVAFFGGSTAQRLSSKEVVRELLTCGAEVNVVNRKRLMHAKVYGKVSSAGQDLVVTSGNFTGPGMSQNVEASIWLRDADTSRVGFDWPSFVDRLRAQPWHMHQPTLTAPTDPAWSLLYAEATPPSVAEESEQVTLLVRLGHSDTARILAAPGTRAARGTQYFWISKDSFDFFPPLLIPNTRGTKATFSAIITMHYPDIAYTDPNCRVTFEAENNFDFRLGTAPLRHTGIARAGDIACISRIGESEYTLRIVPTTSSHHSALDPYLINHVGAKGKRYGYIDNTDFEAITGIRPAPL